MALSSDPASALNFLASAAAGHCFGSAASASAWCLRKSLRGGAREQCTYTGHARRNGRWSYGEAARARALRARSQLQLIELAPCRVELVLEARRLLGQVRFATHRLSARTV